MRHRFRILVSVLSVATAAVEAYIGPDHICWIDVFAPFTMLNGEKAVAFVDAHQSIGWASMVAAALAAEHFNARDASLVPQLGNADIQACDVTLEINTVFDTGYDSNDITRDFLEHVFETNFTIPRNPHARPKCALAGPSADSAIDDMTSVAYAAHLPMVTTFSSQLVKSGDVFTKCSVYPDLLEKGVFLTSYLLYQKRTDYIALLHPLSDWGAQVRTTLGLIFDKNNMKWMSSEYVESEATSVDPSNSEDTRSIRSAVRRIKESGFRTVVFAIGDDFVFLPLVADALEENKMLDGGYFFISFEPIDLNGQTLEGSNIVKVATGLAELVPLTRNFYQGKRDPLFRTWKLVNQTFVDKMNMLNPIDPDNKAYVNATLSMFQNQNSLEFEAPFMYDAIMAIGFGACQAKQQADGSIEGLDHYQAILNTSFLGESGVVQFGDKLLNRAGTRPGNTMLWAVQNWYLDGQGEVQPQIPSFALPFCNSSVSKRPVEEEYFNEYCALAPTERRQVKIPFGGGTLDFIWVNFAVFAAMNNITSSPVQYIYSGNTTTAPTLLRDEGDPNYLSKSIRAFGLTFMALTQFIALAIAIWVYACRKHRVLAASQPIFLYIICAGCILQSFTVFCRSFDEGAGWSQEDLARNCRTLPWLFVMGQLVVSCALFSKLWRVQKTLQFSRRQVGYGDVLYPMILLILIAIFILALWTALDPLTWKRNVKDEETNETVGSCKSSSGGTLAAYVVPLAVVLVSAGGLMAMMAWRTRDVDAAYSESKQIGLLLLVQLEVLLVAAPVLMRLNNDFATTGYAVLVAAILIFPLSTLGFIFGPKINDYIKDVRGMDKNTRKRGQHGAAPQVTGLEPPVQTPSPVEEAVASSWD